MFEEWQGESVRVFSTDGDKNLTVEGIVKAAKNNAMIIAPNSGRKPSILLEFKNIDSICAARIVPPSMKPVSVEDVRQHLLMYHNFDDETRSAQELLTVHEYAHKHPSEYGLKYWGHVHRAS